MEWLKELLNTAGIEEDKVAGIVEGVGKELPKHFVPKSQYNETAEAKKRLESDLSDRDKQLTDLKKAAEGNEGLQATIKELQEANKATAEKYENDMKELRTNTALKLAVANDVHDPDLLLGLIDKTRIEIGDDGSVKGLDEQIKSLRESKGFLFKEAPKGPQFKGVVPRDGTDGLDGPTPEQAKFQARIEAARKSNNQVEVIAIKREAAQAGVQLN